jgi:hypothetical protein
VTFSLFTFYFSLSVAAQRPGPGRVEVLTAVDGLPPAVVGQFREAAGFEQATWGQYVVFDRRGHAVYGIDEDGGSSRQIVKIGGEDGNLLEPHAFDAAPDGSFAVADAPNGRERVQIFDAGGFRRGGFRLPGQNNSTIVLNGVTLNGVGTLLFTGKSVILSLPETGWLMTEFGSLGTPVRSIGQLRATGHEEDRQLHFALNAGIALPDSTGGYYFVFMAGPPAFRKYDGEGRLIYERTIQGREIDPVVAAIPQRWPKRPVNGTEAPLVAPTIRTAAVDPGGRLWVAFVVPYTYVYDADGEKIRTVQFRAAGIVAPASLSFTAKGRLLVTPGCYEFLPN